jgi:PAS domain S-box-containing protein
MISVLYVDDEPGLLELVRLYLEQDGQFSVATISSARAALALLDQTRYDCIVSDYMMPEMDGIRFLKTVRASKNTIPFILFTGRGREEVIIQAIDEGADFYIQKGGDPVPQFTELAHKIQQAVDKRRAEKQLRESEEKFRSYVETSPDIIWEIDLQGTIRYVSPQIRTIMGFSPEEIIGRSIIDMVPEQIKSIIKRELADYGSHKGSLTPLEVPVRHRDGRTLVIEIRPSVTDTNGNHAGFRGLAVDITERKRAEEALHRANRQLGLLTGITRHDILNKVSVILGYLRIAEKRNTDPAIGSYLQKIDAATTAVRSQIEFTRVYQDLGTHEPQWLALDEVMPRLYLPPAVALKADGHGIQVYADPMLERVFFNLLDNSIRHGQRVSEIRVMPLCAGEDLVVVWEDNGIGIPAEEKERIFERGFGRNSGLGMFMVREILSLTGITIRENGVPGTGSRFEIVVPNGAFRMPDHDKTGNTIRKNPVRKPSTAGQEGALPETGSTAGQ